MQNKEKNNDLIINRKNVFLIYGSRYLTSLTAEEFKRLDVSFRIGQAHLENRAEIVNEIKRIQPTNILCFSLDLECKKSSQVEAIRSCLVGELNLADVADELNVHCTIVASANLNKKNPGEEKNDEECFLTNLKETKEKLLRSYTNVSVFLYSSKLLYM